MDLLMILGLDGVDRRRAEEARDVGSASDDVPLAAAAAALAAHPLNLTSREAVPQAMFPGLHDAVFLFFLSIFLDLYIDEP